MKKYNTNDPVADSCVGVALLDSWRGDWVATETDPLKTICDKKEWLKPPPGEAWSSFEWAFKMLSWMWEEKMIWKNCEPFTDEENSWGPYDARMPLMAKLASWKLRVESGERLMEEELAVDRMTPDGMDRQYSHKWKGV